MKHSALIATSVVLVWCLLTSPAQSVPNSSGGSAQPFAQRLLRSLNETSGGPGDWQHLSRHGGYDPSFIHLMNENGRLADGIDLMEADPLCQCQDTGGHYTLKSLAQRDADNASMGITGAYGPVTAILRRTTGVWRVYDVVDASGSFRARLIRHNTCMRTHHDPTEWTRCFAEH